MMVMMMILMLTTMTLIVSSAHGNTSSVRMYSVSCIHVQQHMPQPLRDAQVEANQVRLGLCARGLRVTRNPCMVAEPLV